MANPFVYTRCIRDLNYDFIANSKYAIVTPSDTEGTHPPSLLTREKVRFKGNMHILGILCRGLSKRFPTQVYGELRVRWSMFVGRSPERPPTENTLTANVIHEILDEIHDVFPDTIAVIPNRAEEKEDGYDASIDWPWHKIFALQFKSYQKKSKINLEGSRTDEDYYKFKLDREQHEQLRRNFPLRRMAFYTLPVFPTRDSMELPLLEQNLPYYPTKSGTTGPHFFSPVIFIDVHDIPLGATMISISRPSENDDYRSAFSYCKDRRHHTIDHRKVLSWDDIWEGLLSCQMGTLIRRGGSKTGELADLVGSWEQPEGAYPADDKMQDTMEIALRANELPDEASEWARE